MKYYSVNYGNQYRRYKLGFGLFFYPFHNKGTNIHKETIQV